MRGEQNAITLEDGSNLGELVKEGATYTSLRHLKSPPPVMHIMQRTLHALQVRTPVSVSSAPIQTVPSSP
jgi:hypothetical protein